MTVGESEPSGTSLPDAGDVGVPTKTKRSWASWLRKWALRAVIAVLLMLFAGFAWDQIATWNFLRNYPPPGEMFDVGGINLHAVIRGEREAGQAAIVIEPGVDGGTSAWLHIVNELQSDAQIVVMDRRGIGYSEGAGDIRTPEQNVADLREVLELKGVAPPYLLVGHSLGGHNIRLFESLYPDEVAGMVLVDAMNTDHLTTSLDVRMPILKFVAATGRFGSERVLDVAFRQELREDLGIDIARVRGTSLQGGTVKNVMNHWHGVAVDWKERRAQLSKAISVPLTIIAAKGPPIESLEWNEGQQRLRELSPNAKYIDTGRQHELHLRKPDLIVNEVKAMLDSLQSE